MDVGFTGTQHGMTANQARSFMKFLADLGITCGHHGCCVGVDKQVHILLMWLLGENGIILHPPEDLSKVPSGIFGSFPAENIRKPRPYLERNHDIVDETKRLVGLPYQSHEIMRSGTWATVRYAKKTDKPVTIIWPNGDLANTW